MAAASIYITFLPASLIAIDGKDGAAAISLQPHFTTDRIGQVVLGRQQGEGLRNITPRLLRPVRRDLRSSIERALEQASDTLSGDKLLFDCITMDEQLRQAVSELIHWGYLKELSESSFYFVLPSGRRTDARSRFLECRVNPL